jgi:SNF2 family DNA or RNA helicase
MKRKIVSFLFHLCTLVCRAKGWYILATLATNKLQAIFATILLRRKKDSMLDGKRLIELPDKAVDLLRLDFSEEERAIYNMASSASTC